MNLCLSARKSKVGLDPSENDLSLLSLRFRPFIIQSTQRKVALKDVFFVLESSLLDNVDQVKREDL